MRWVHCGIALYLNEASDGAVLASDDGSNPRRGHRRPNALGIRVGGPSLVGADGDDASKVLSMDRQVNHRWADAPLYSFGGRHRADESFEYFNLSVFPKDPADGVRSVQASGSHAWTLRLGVVRTIRSLDIKHQM